MIRTRTIQALLGGAVLIAVGWILAVPLGGRDAQEVYRNDEDFYTLLTLAGGVLMLSGLVLLAVGLFRASRKVDKMGSSGTCASPTSPDLPSERQPI